MTKDETLKMLLVHFELWNHGDSIFYGEFDYQINAIKEALAQPEPWEKFCDSYCVWTDHHPDCKLAEQEPVAWRAWVSKFPQGTGSDWVYVTKPIMKDRIHNQPLYTTPPQRTWVGLTEAQCGVLWKTNMTPFEYYQAIEAKLKEKNT